MYSMPGRLEMTSASLWMTTVSKPPGAISRAIAATSAEGHDTRILGSIRFPSQGGLRRAAPSPPHIIPGARTDEWWARDVLASARTRFAHPTDYGSIRPVPIDRAAAH